MIRLINFLMKLSEVYPITTGVLGVLVVIGFISIVRWTIVALTGSDTPVKPLPVPTKAPTPSLSAFIAREAVRLKLEDLYHQGKIAKETLEDLFTSFQMWSTKPLQPTVGSPSLAASIMATSSSVKETPLSVESKPQEKISVPPSDLLQKPSGFFSSENIKTMLVSGCALFIFSAYLFVRSYWEHIPAVVKFFSLVIATIGIHFGGKTLIGKRETPKTSETLLTLATLLVPFNFYAGNYLLLDGAFSAYASWAFGAAAMCLAGIYTASFLATTAIGTIIGLGFMGSFVFGSLALPLTPQSQYLVMAVGTLLLLVMGLIVEMKEDIQNGLRYVVNGACALIVLGLVSNGLFLDTANHLGTVAALLIIAGAFAIEARTVGYAFAYGAGLCFAAAMAVFLHHLNVPTYKYGLFFVPAAILATLRAWTFERQGKKELAAPYFHLGQLAIAGSLFAITPYLAFYVESGFVTLLTILVLATTAYALNGILFKSPVFTYLGGTVVLFLSWTCTWRYDLPFTEAVLVMSGVGSLFVLAGLIGGSKFDDLLGQPISIVGLGSVTACLALLAGKWGLPFLQDGTLQTRLVAGQLTSAIQVGGLGVIAYGLVAVVRKQAALVFPALASATLTYFFFLERISVPINLLNTSWIVLVSMAMSYGAHAVGWKQISRCFAVWGEMVFGVILVSGLASRPDTALPALLVCLVALLPGLLTNKTDVVTCFLSAVYAAHYVWFRGTMAGVWEEKMFAYGAQLLVLNCSVVFGRTLISAWRPGHNVFPYRVFALTFSCISLLMVIHDKANAWQIYLAYGVLALIVSMVHYEGRFKQVGSTLLLISYELFLWSQNVRLTEAYSVPAGMYLLVCGYFVSGNRDLRNVLYGAAQVVLYLPSFSKAVNETWEMHGVFLGVESLALMLFGIHQRNKCLTFGSLFVLLGNGVVQSFQFLTAIPRWLYLALGGTTLVGLGGLFEFQREKLVAARNQMSQAFEGWD